MYSVDTEVKWRRAWLSQLLWRVWQALKWRITAGDAVGSVNQPRLERISYLWRRQASSFEVLLGPNTLQDNTCPHEPGAPEAQHPYLIFWFASEMSSVSSWFQQRPPGTVLEGRVPLKGGVSLVEVEEQQELDFSGHSWLLVLPCFLLPNPPWCKQPPRDSCSHDLSCSTMPSLPQWAENKSQNNLSSLVLFLLDSNTMLTGIPQQSKRDRLISLLFSVCVYMFVYTDVCVRTEDKLKLLFLRCQSPFLKL